jgi:RNA polymerase sigma factor (sigma-70 family)
LQFVHRTAGLPTAADQTDRQLLETFASKQNQANFDELVRRHGSLVLGVCRRVLQDEHDAEDAFQATFLVFSRKAGSIRWHESVKHWLYEVAYRVAVRARGNRARRRAREREIATRPEPASRGEVSWREVQLALDEELHRLPAKYRTPLLLCYLEGQTQEEAARQLGCSPNGIRARLWRGRDLLRERLALRGLKLSVVLLATLIVENAPAAVPGTLLAVTAKAGVDFATGQTACGLVSVDVLNLTHGVLNTMFLNRIKMTAAVLLSFALLAVGGGMIVHRALADRPAQVAAEPQAQQAQDAQPIATIKAVDVAKSSLTLVFKKGSTEQTFTLAKDIRVTADGKPAKAGILAEGLSVLNLSVAPKDKTVVTEITVQQPKK